MGLQKTNDSPDVILDHVRVEPHEQSYVHNHYYDKRFLHCDPIAGVVTNHYGERVLRVSEEFIIGLSRGLELEVGERSASDIMYKAGFRWGAKGLKNFSARMQQEFECEFDKFGMGFMLETWWWPYQVHGWGAWQYDFTQGKHGLIFVELFDSAVAKTLGNVGHVVCHFYAGLFASTFAGLAKRDLGGIEIQCYAMGEDHCKFLIAGPKRVDAAEFWREEGAVAKDLVKKIKEVHE